MRLFTQNQTRRRDPFGDRPRRVPPPSQTAQQAGNDLQEAFDSLFGSGGSSSEQQVENVASASEASIGTLSSKTPNVVDTSFQEKNPSASPKVPVGDALKSSTSGGTPQARFFSTTDSKSEIAPLKFSDSENTSRNRIDQTDMTAVNSASERLNVKPPENDEELRDFEELSVIQGATQQLNQVFGQANDALTGAQETTASVAQSVLNETAEIEPGTGNVAQTSKAQETAQSLFSEFEETAAPKLDCLPNLGLENYFDPTIPGFEDVNVNTDILECVGETIDQEARNCGVEGVIPLEGLVPKRTIQNMFNTLSCFAVENNLGSIAENLLSSFKVDESTQRLLKRRFPEVHDNLDWRSIKNVTGAMGDSTNWPHKDIFLDDLKTRQDIESDEDVNNALEAANNLDVDPSQIFKRPNLSIEPGTGNNIAPRGVEAGTGNVLDVWDTKTVESSSSPLSRAVIDPSVRNKIGGRQISI